MKGEVAIWIFNRWNDPSDLLEDKVFNVLDDLNDNSISDPYTFNVEGGDWEDFTRKMRISRFPAVAIMLDQGNFQFALIEVLEANPSEERIKRELLKAIDNPIPKQGDDNGNRPGEQVVIGLSDDGAGGLGLGLGGNAPSWAYWLLIGYSGYKALTTKRSGVWYGVGGLGIIGLLNKPK